MVPEGKNKLKNPLVLHTDKIDDENSKKLRLHSEKQTYKQSSAPDKIYLGCRDSISEYFTVFPVQIDPSFTEIFLLLWGADFSINIYQT